MGGERNERQMRKKKERKVNEGMREQQGKKNTPVTPERKRHET